MSTIFRLPVQTKMILAQAAVRANELGVTEAQMEALGSQPGQLLVSIRTRGNPPECAPLVAYLAALPPVDPNG